MVEVPPGGATTRVVGTSVRKLPLFWLLPLANTFADTAPRDAAGWLGRTEAPSRPAPPRVPLSTGPRERWLLSPTLPVTSVDFFRRRLVRPWGAGCSAPGRPEDESLAAQGACFVIRIERTRIQHRTVPFGCPSQGDEAHDTTGCTADVATFNTRAIC